MVLSYDAYNEALENQKEERSKIDIALSKIDDLYQKLGL
jgi:hypothetical protein